MRVVSLDLSLTCTGVADSAGVRTLKPKSTGMERLVWARDAVLLCACRCVLGRSTDHSNCPVMFQADLVVIEGYSMGTTRQSSHAHGLGELGGVVRLALWEAGIPFVDVAPASLKKYATGKGNANKDAVLTAAVRRLGYQGDSHDEADALWLRAMALDHYGEPVATVPAEHRKALAAVKWPVLDLAVTA